MQTDEAPSLIAEAAVPPVETPAGETPTAPETPPQAEAPKAETPPAQQEFQFDAEAFKLPEGFTVDEAVKGEFIDLAKKLEIDAGKASELAGFQAKLEQARVAAQVDSWNKMQTEWRTAVQSDPEIGGDKLPTVLTDVAKIVDQYGSPELREVMTLTGAGNNIHVVRFLHNIAKQLVEPAPVLGAPASAPKSLAESLFDTMQKG